MVEDSSTRTVPVKLNMDESAADLLHQTTDHFLDAANHVVDVVWESDWKITSKQQLHDLTASETFLQENSDREVRPMARPVRFEWDDHDWSGKPDPHESPKEVRTDPEVASVDR
ncbi:hypothetical protein SAMN06264855_104242 [Halorubrum vacuolatum]|uniref:Uncharacterized protein n=1 Tax=Halorubrum vacuolatum TaxID=63740 RepID=A0A238VZA9_HALVU|nr:hypothetical protein SAMN06264855_104242 [Halorubrum vacuolatum]